jgi:transposase InsO family protein
VSIKYSGRLAEAGIAPSVGSKGDSYENALAETINGLYKAELIHRRLFRRRTRLSNWLRSNGCPGLTTIACWNHSAISAGRGRSKLLQATERPGHPGLTHPNWPPRKPGRFMSVLVSKRQMSVVVEKQPASLQYSLLLP